MARKLQLADLPATPDPRSALDTPTFLRAARPVLTALTADLLARADADPGIRAALEQHHQAELEASRTADDYAVWRRHIVVQVAAAWLLSCVFVRVLEDRSLIASRIAGTGARDSEEAFFRVAPSLGEREYLLIIFRELARLPAAAPLFAPEHNLVWRLGPSAEGCKRLLQLFRMPHADAPTFRFGDADTRFLGDLYQHIDDEVRKRFALLQTPNFVEHFILDRTLSPALAEYGVDHVDIIDPTCGSGHFLLGAFSKIYDQLRQTHPTLNERTLANTALSHIYGVDINPYAAGIARFRLTLRFIETGTYTTLLGAPKPTLNIIVADSLFYGPSTKSNFPNRNPEQDISQRPNNIQRAFSLEDPQTAIALLSRTYAAVVGNPPYITAKDRVLREFYRNKFTAAFGKYSLSTPFMECFFCLAKPGGGYVGKITANSFMKREFGAPLIEDVLTRFDIELIVNSAGAYIPGHKTPTVILFGRNQPSTNKHIQAVLSRRGEPKEPISPADGHVWRSIVEHWSEIGFENDYISVDQIFRKELQTHPWMLEGGGAVALKAKLEKAGAIRLKNFAHSIGISACTLEDDVFIRPTSSWKRLKMPLQSTRPMVIGEAIRDWRLDPCEEAFFPYGNEQKLKPQDEIKADLRILWPWRTNLSNNISFGKTKADKGLAWYEYGGYSYAKFASNDTIAYAFIATHNHFIFSREARVFKQTAPIIKLPHRSDTLLHLATLSYLNSSVACFYMKQVAHPKSSPTNDASKEKGKPENVAHEFSCTAIGALPLPDLSQDDSLSSFALQLDNLQKKRDKLSPYHLMDSTLAGGLAIPRAFELAQAEDASLQAKMVAIQEDLDWSIYAIFGLASPCTAKRWTENLELNPHDRPFCCAHPPQHLSPTDRKLWEARAKAIAASKELRLIENPINKRHWRSTSRGFGYKAVTYAERVADAAVEHIADLAEQILRTRCERSLPAVFTARDLERDLDREPKYHALRDYLHTRDPAHDPLRDQLARESVPFLAGYRYSPAGRDRHERWREVWALQRIADVSEAELPRLREAAEAAAASAREAAEALSALRQRLGFPTFPLAPDLTPPRRGARKTTPPPPPPPPVEDPATKPPELLAAEAHELAVRGAQNQARLELAEAESHHHKLRKLIPVPSKYEPTDFRDPNYFRLRGKLDVPRERFISYPDAASDGDPSPVYGWAGWDHLQRALALLQLYYHRKLEETWPAERLIPLLAGLEELLPWVRQWHADERHSDTGELYADALDAHITAGCSELGVTRPQLVAWAPSDARRGRAASPVNRAHKTAVPRTKPSTASLANRRSARRADAVSLDPEAPPPELTNKRRAGRRASESPSTPDPVDATATPRRRGRSRNAG